MHAWRASLAGAGSRQERGTTPHACAAARALHASPSPAAAAKLYSHRCRKSLVFVWLTVLPNSYKHETFLPFNIEHIHAPLV